MAEFFNTLSWLSASSPGPAGAPDAARERLLEALVEAGNVVGRQALAALSRLPA